MRGVMRGAASTIKSVRELLSGRRFGFPSYQRDYSWPDDVVKQLCADLIEVFHERAGGHREPEYFLGLIVTVSPVEQDADTENLYHVVDGQQRLTTLALLLTCVASVCEDPLRGEIRSLLLPNGSAVLATTGFRETIASFSPAVARPKRGRKRNSTSYMERVREVLDLGMEWIGGAFEISDTSADSEIAEFGRWVLDHVHAVELVDTDPYDDQLLFDRINTRGHPLAQADTFRSRMLARGADSRKSTEREWQAARVNAAQAYDKNPTLAAIDCERKLMVAWLVARHARVARDANFGAEHRKINKDPYEWAWAQYVSDDSRDFFRSLREDFFSLARDIVPVLKATRVYRQDLPGFFTAHLAGLPLVDAFAAAILKPTGNSTRNADLKSASQFLDAVGSRLLLRKDWNPSKTELTSLMLEAVRQAADMSGPQLRAVLTGVLVQVPRSFKPEALPSLTTKPTSRSKLAIRYANLRMSEYISRLLGVSDAHGGLNHAEGRPPQVEHLMGNDFETYSAIYQGVSAWREARERFGALTVLAPSENASVQTKPFAAKAKIYASSYLIAASITPVSYPGGRLRGKRTPPSFPLRALDGIGPEHIADRERMLCALAELVWPL
jgi:hypothetical protein